MISQSAKAVRIPTVTGVYDSYFQAKAAISTEQVALSITGAQGLLNSLSTLYSLSPSYAVTIRVRVDGVTVYTSQAVAAAMSDLLGDSTFLRRAFPNGVAFRSSLVITCQIAVGGGGTLNVNYNAVTVDSL